MKLRILDYIKDVKEHNGVSLSAKLQCTCGCSNFEFSHTGKQEAFSLLLLSRKMDS